LGRGPPAPDRLQRGATLTSHRPGLVERAGAAPAGSPGRVAFWAIGLGGAAALFLLWQVIQPLLVIGAGILIGVLLDACVRGIRWLLPIGRAFALALTCLAFTTLFVGAFTWGGYQLAVQAEALVQTATEVFDDWRAELDLLGISGDSDEADEAAVAAEAGEQESGSESVAKFFVPDPENLVERVGSVFRTTFGAIGDTAVIIFVAIFTAADPNAYRNGLLSLVPPRRREDFARLLDDTGTMLRWWLLGQLVAMLAVGTATWLLLTAIGMPSALLLGLQAGILTFIPFLGPFLGGAAIMLVAMAQGGTMIFWALGGYVLIQSAEGYLLTPLVQQRTVDVRPLLVITAMILFGTLFGLLGIALATPLVAVIRLLVLRLYVDDALGGAHLPTAEKADPD
jgi:predicted PurR-regulated permease PerM